MSAPVDPFRGRVTKPPLLLVVSGPSAVGKTSLCHRLVEAVDDAVYSVSATTRPMRPAESDGEEYFFHTPDSFEALRRQGNLLESAEVHDHAYGTPRSFVEQQLGLGRVVVLNIDVQGGIQVMSSYPDAAFVFILPPSVEELRRRIRGRGQDAIQDMERRLANAPGELAEAARYTYVVVNDHLESCLERLKAIVTAERSLRRRCFQPISIAHESTREGGPR